jgi:hypothetical protein
MSLVRLLRDGKSLIGLQDSVPRYRMRAKNLLPKFGSTKNPFSTSTSEPAQTAAKPAAQIARYQMTPAELAAARLKETKELPMPASVEFKKAETAPVSAATSNWLRQWTQKLNPFSGWSWRKTLPKRSLLGPNKPTVQGELSLDRVKVMRNDLSDAEVELVPAKPAAKPKPEPAVKMISRAEESTELIKS